MITVSSVQLSSQRLQEPIAERRSLSWLEDSLYAGVSALLLVLLSLHTQLTPVYLMALVPYFWRLLNSDLRRAVWLGVLVANSFVFVAYADNLILAPAMFVLQLTYFNLIFVSYGVAVSRAKETYGRSALLLVFLWLPLEYCLRLIGGSSEIISSSAFTSTQAARFTVLLNILIIPAFVTLLNPMLLLLGSAILKTIELSAGPQRERNMIRRFISVGLVVSRRWYLCPDFLSPPEPLLATCAQGSLTRTR